MTAERYSQSAPPFRLARLTPTQGYAPTRDAAMAAFAKSWEGMRDTRVVGRCWWPGRA
jgi:hypothetical protein